ncbi:MAG TPA: Rad52/Rad22 family DNA repair protein, partial [Pseudolabrys sp.]|nr:Rad52/Rad22 family DNA repair protein [Pseudolabrys sp.]
VGDVHDIALKAAETDATKRALATFGKPFGLALYGRLISSPPIAGTSQIQISRAQVPLPPDDTTPIPRPSRYYGRRQDLVTRDRAQARKSLAAQPQALPNTSLVPEQPDATPDKIDKSALTIGEPKRIREKAHLRFVASHPCLVCGRQPADPHHLRFAQPRALGMKVSDEFTVPLCRDHHRQLHHAGNEIAWWNSVNIKPLPIAKALWFENHPVTAGGAGGESADGDADINDQDQTHIPPVMA